MLTLAISLGGYTVAESATQRADDAALAAQELAAARAEALALRAAVEGERERAVATAQDAIADATAVQTVAATTVPAAEVAPLVAAVDELNELLVAVPEAPLPAVPGEDGTATDDTSGTTPTDIPAMTDGDAEALDEADASAPVVERGARASRASGAREPLVDPTDDAVPAPADPADQADQADQAEAAEQVEEAAEAPAPEGAPTDATGDVADGGLEEATGEPVPADDAQPDDALSVEILAAVARVTEVAAQVQATADANLAAQQAAAAAAAQAEAQAAAAAAAEAAEKAAQRASLDAYANGRIPDEALCDLPEASGHQLRCDAAEALTALDAAYRAQFGTPLSISDSYRSYPAQVACVRVKGYLCARPGTSNHGLGVAVDLAGGIQSFGTAQHRWMAANAGQYGWILPGWASAGGSKPEAWHWEYTG